MCRNPTRIWKFRAKLNEAWNYANFEPFFCLKFVDCLNCEWSLHDLKWLLWNSIDDSLFYWIYIYDFRFVCFWFQINFSLSRSFDSWLSSFLSKYQRKKILWLYRARAWNSNMFWCAWWKIDTNHITLDQ